MTCVLTVDRDWGRPVWCPGWEDGDEASDVLPGHHQDDKQGEAQCKVTPLLYWIISI